MKILSMLFIGAVGVGFAFPGRGQNTTSAPAAADPQWERLRACETAIFQSAAISSGQNAGGATIGSSASSPMAARCLRYADELDTYYTAHSTSANANEARRLEALMLVYARLNGAASVGDRCDALVKQVRSDASLPAVERFGVASLSDLNLSVQASATGAQSRGDAMESVVRALLKEFPDVPAAVEGLLRLAESSGDIRAERIANDLVAMKIPAEIKRQAQRLVDRYALVGQSLPALLGTALPDQGRGSASTSGGHRTIVYAWSMSTDGVFNGKRIGAVAPAGTVIIGLNTDADSVAARKFAADQNLPGTQVYAPTGLDPQLAEQLKPSGHDLALVADAAGIVRSVSLHLDPAAKLAVIK